MKTGFGLRTEWQVACRSLLLTISLGCVVSSSLAGELLAATGVDVRGGLQSQISLAVPSFHGLEPELTLSYSSSVANGVVGVGWQIGGLSSISRVSVGRGAPHLDATDIFLLDGLELIPCAATTPSPSCQYPASSGYVAYATKTETFLRVAFDPATTNWYVWDKRGVKKTYTPRAPLGALPPYKWDLLSTVDTVGNSVTYGMSQDTPQGAVGESYIDTISYDGYVLKFYYEDRPDPLTYGIGYGLIALRKRLKAVDITAGSSRSAVYELSYNVRPVTGRSFLQSVQRFGTDAQVDASGGVSNSGSVSSDPPITLGQMPAAPDNWQANALSDPKWGMPQVGGGLPPVINGAAFQLANPYRRFTPSNLGDFDGNGQTDWVQAAPDLVFQPNGKHTSVTFTTALAGSAVPVITQEILPWPFTGLIKATFAGDVDGDGRSDLIFVLEGASVPGADPTPDPRFLDIVVAFSNGDGTFRWASQTEQTTDWETRELSTNRVSKCSVGDVDGDGRADLVCSFTREDGSHHLGTALSKGDGTFAASEQQMPFALQGETRLMALGDANGDGLADPMFLDFPHCPDTQPDCTVQYELVTAYSRGNGIYDFERTPTDWDRGSPLFFAADIDGDGKSDYVVSASIPQGSGADGALLTAIHKPDGGYLLNRQTLPAALLSVESTFTVGDANGDGKADLMVISRQDPGKNGCSTTLSGVHVNLHRVLSLGNGFFDLPVSWQDCTGSTELAIDWQNIQFTPVEPQAADLNGDGTADFLIAAASSSTNITTLFENLSGSPQGDTYDWMPAEINGDGKVDWIYIRDTASGPLITALASNANGYTPLSRGTAAGTDRLTVIRNWRVLDINGDGLDDLVYIRPLGVGKGAEIDSWIVDGHGGWKLTTQVVLTGRSTSVANMAAWRITAGTGDGKRGLVYLAIENGQLFPCALLSVGDGTWTEQVPGAGVAASDGNVRNWRVADVNGDGRTDLIHLISLQPGLRVETLLGNGDGTWNPAPQSPADFQVDASGSNLFDTLYWYVMDVNGDGKTDLVHLSPSTVIPGNPVALRVQSLVSLGLGAWQLTDQTLTATYTGDMRNWRAGSVDGDERDDLVHYQVTPPSIVLNTLSYIGTAGWTLSTPTISVSDASQTSMGSYFVAADTNGDGNSDLSRFDLSANGLRLLTLRSTYSMDTVARITNSWGGFTDISYQSASAALASDSTVNCHLPSGFGLSLVSDLTTNDGRGAASTQHYDFSCAHWSWEFRGLLGWEDRYASRADVPGMQGGTTQDHFLISDQCLTEPSFRRTYDSTGKMYSIVVTAYFLTQRVAPYRCQLIYKDNIAVDNPSYSLNEITYYDYDSFGNTTHVYEYGANGSNSGNARTTTIAYKPNTSAYIVGLPYQVTVGDGVLPVTKTDRYTYFCYDNDNGSDSSSCFGTISKGLLTAVKAVNKNGWYDSTIYTYDTHGNVQTVTDANNHTSTIGYESQFNLFPNKRCNALNQCSFEVWDDALQQLHKLTDENNVDTTTDYDPLGRAHMVTLGNGATVTFDWQQLGDPTSQHVKVTLSDNAGSSVWSDHYLDGLSREYRTNRSAPGAGGYQLDTAFAGATGLPWTVSHWHDVGATVYQETLSYDLLGRPVLASHAGSSIGWAYDNSDTQTIVRQKDEVGHVVSQFYDEFGRLARVRTGLAATQATDVQFAYDAADELYSMTDAQGSASIVNYDVRGNQLELKDPDRGDRLFDWDYVGKLKRSIDAKGAWTRYDYDAIDRISYVQYPSYREVHYYYDEPNHGASIGRLTTIVDYAEYKCPIKPGFSYLTEERFYDNYGRLISQTRCIEGVTTQMQYGYDGLGRVQTVTYPDGDIVTYDYDEAGRTKGLSGWVNEIDYNAADQIVGVTYANGDQETLKYNPEREWLTNLTTKGSVSTLFSGKYDYYANRLVKQVQEQRLRLTFGYDSANHLRKIRGSVNQDLSIDNVGNIANNSLVGQYTYSGAAGCGTAPAIPCPHAVKSAGAQTLQYDENGNLTGIKAPSGGALTRSVTWNSDGQVAGFTDALGVPTTVRLDWTGRQVYRERQGASERYFNRFLELDQPTPAASPSSTQFYYAGSLLVGRKDASGKYWTHRDRLGSVRVVSDSTGHAVARGDFAPLGKARGTPSKLLQYTGHRFDADNGFLDLGARFYEPNLGRVISPDPSVPNLRVGDALNPYAFAYNNPEEFVEPRGLDPVPASAQSSASSELPADVAQLARSFRSSKDGMERVQLLGEGLLAWFHPDTTPASERTDKMIRNYSLMLGYYVGLGQNTTKLLAGDSLPISTVWDEKFQNSFSLLRLVGVYSAGARLFSEVSGDSRRIASGVFVLPQGYQTSYGEVLGQVDPATMPVVNTAKSGLELEPAMREVLRQRFPKTQFEFSSRQYRPDVRVVGGLDPGFDVADFKPDTRDNELKALRQLREWDQSEWLRGGENGGTRGAVITYMPDGTLYLRNVWEIFQSY